MNEKALRVLEYPKIIERLTKLAGSEPGKKLCSQLVPSTDLSLSTGCRLRQAMRFTGFIRKAAFLLRESAICAVP